MHATRISDTLFTGDSLPANATIALVWSCTIALVLEATRQTDWLFAIFSLPPGQAHHFALIAASEMAINIIAWPTQNVTLFAEIIWLTSDSIGVSKRCCVRLVHAICPLIFHRQPAMHWMLQNQLFLVQIISCSWQLVVVVVVLMCVEMLSVGCCEMVQTTCSPQCAVQVVVMSSCWWRCGRTTWTGRLVPSVDHERKSALCACVIEFELISNQLIR